MEIGKTLGNFIFALNRLIIETEERNIGLKSIA